ncbi:MAG: NifB/NifX family molybdenum-iron cluster-binding protein [Candidatus Eremiobacteraeota bacterium]|nr:NifB/NifX family molybdenum-iron cluster-binding protein [Candidatus Eremiobacteraeota bacterium]
MKVAITSQGTSLDSQVDPRFGRARYFIIIDPVSESFEVVDNTINRTRAQGAGIQAAQTVSAQGVEWVLTGHMGPNAFNALRAANIKIGTGASGTIREVLRKFKEGYFEPVGGADVAGHW